MVEDRKVIEETIQEVAKIVTEMAGIQLGQRQLPMIENRLKTRMLRLEVNGFKEYLNYLRKNKETESQALLSLMTTHHTFFFREFSHFEFLLNKGLPRLIEIARNRPDKTIHILSAACSRGHEVYSLAMFFHFHLNASAPDVKFQIWGTDIDPESVKYAKNGVYKADELKQSPAMYLNGHWIRGTGQVRDFSKVRNELKTHCHFTVGNLLSYESFLQGKKFDVIFCRNVFIYFNPSQIKTITEKLMKSLDSEGLIFLGLSETLNGLQTGLNSVGPSVYQRPISTGKLSIVQAPKATTPKIIEVLCVDDSPIIHALLKKILVAEEGFRITATANNGREAIDILKRKKFDFITLDLHMPELDGIGFLKEKQGNDTPVLVISSINRDDTSIAQKALSLGASDYVEKPSLENLSQAGNEIRSKMKFIIANQKRQTPSAPQLETSSNSTKVRIAEKSEKIRVMIVDDSKTIRTLLSSILKRDSRFEVVAEAEKPSEVAELIEKTKPNVITLDIHMPEMNGVELLKKIRPKFHIPTVMISSISREEGTYVLDALASGAVDYIQKPASSQIAQVSKDICDRIASAAKAQVRLSPIRAQKSVITGALNKKSLILIGASTGGTEAIRTVLESMPTQIPPILIVQHIPPVFSTAFAERLNHLCPFDVKEAQDGDEIKANQVLIAPGGKQMGVKIVNDKLFVQISDAPPMNRHKPSVDYLFQNVAQAQLKNVVAAVLTGMGADGAKQLKVLRDQGARTISQNEATCVVYGMPREAVLKGGSEFVLPLESIGQKLIQLCQIQESKRKIS